MEVRTSSGPWSFFRRMRILAAGQLVEDIDQHNRIHEMMSFLISPDSAMNDAAKAFGYAHNKHLAIDRFQFGGIRPGDSWTVLFKPLSGLLNHNSTIPSDMSPSLLSWS